MNEQDVRALVREAIERHLGRPERSANAEHYESREHYESHALVRSAGLQAGQHPSHVLLKVLPGSDADEGMCVIEPRVRCSHCGFCQSYGH
jgi:hypothetical protein